MTSTCTSFIDCGQVDTSRIHAVSPTYLRVNSAGTVPTLVVPLAETTSAEVDTKFRAITSSVQVLEFLGEKSLSLSLSFISTHTSHSGRLFSLAADSRGQGRSERCASARPRASFARGQDPLRRDHRPGARWQRRWQLSSSCRSNARRTGWLPQGTAGDVRQGPVSCA